MTRKKKPVISIILVNWNCGKVILNCIESLDKTIKKYPYEIIVVDNNSKDNSLELIKRKYPHVKLVRNKSNEMFAKANNDGYKVARGEFIFILNSDTTVTRGAVDNLLDYLIKEKKEIVTCTLLNKDGSIQYNMHRGFPTFFRLATSMIYKKYGLFKSLPSVKKYLLISNKFDQDFEVDQAAGAAILISRNLIKKLGYLFDEENFPLFYNDVDLCYRIHKEGIKITCKTNVQIYHLKGESIKKLRLNSHLKTYFFSAARYFKKHSKRLDFFLTELVYLMLSSLV